MRLRSADWLGHLYTSTQCWRNQFLTTRDKYFVSLSFIESPQKGLLPLAYTCRSITVFKKYVYNTINQMYRAFLRKSTPYHEAATFELYDFIYKIYIEIFAFRLTNISDHCSFHRSRVYYAMFSHPPVRYRFCDSSVNLQIVAKVNS